MKLEFEQQVLDFLRLLAPQPRRYVRLGLRALAEGTGDVKALQGKLAGYFRLRVRTYRVIYRYASPPGNGARWLHCVFAEHRSVVYERFLDILRQQG